MAIKTSEFDAFLSISKTNAKARLVRLRGMENPQKHRKEEIDTLNENEKFNSSPYTQEGMEHKKTTNGTQIEHNYSSLKASFSTLVGLQRKIIYFIYQSSKKTRENISEPLSIEHIAHSSNVNQRSVKTSISRLKEKGFIKLAKFKNGRGGWACYEIYDTVYKELIAFEMEHKEFTNGTQKEHENPKDILTSPDINGLLFTTDENNFDEVDFDNKWNLDIEPLENINFYRSHLKQIAKKTKLAPEDVQECIYAFAHDLATNSVKIKAGGSALNFFMGVLTKDTLYSPASPHYVNPKIKAAELYLAKQKEAKKKFKEVDEELRKEHFLNVWSSTLSETEKLSYVPEEVKKSNPPKALITVHLRTYHLENIWPGIRNSFYKEKNLPCIESCFFEE